MCSLGPDNIPATPLPYLAVNSSCLLSMTLIYTCIWHIMGYSASSLCWGMGRTPQACILAPDDDLTRLNRLILTIWGWSRCLTLCYDTILRAYIQSSCLQVFSFLIIFYAWNHKHDYRNPRPESRTDHRPTHLKSYPLTLKSKTNGPIEKTTSAERSSNSSKHPTSNSSQRNTFKKKIREPYRPANTHRSSRRATGPVNSFLGIGSLNLEHHANRWAANPHRLPLYPLQGIDDASASSAIAVLPSASGQGGSLPRVWKW